MKKIYKFWAEWCGPCQLMAPIIESISEEIGDKVKFVKVNTDENMELSMQYRVMSIPTMLVFKRGEIKSTFVGVTDKEELMNALI